MLILFRNSLVSVHAPLHVVDDVLTDLRISRILLVCVILYIKITVISVSMKDRLLLDVDVDIDK